MKGPVQIRQARPPSQCISPCKSALCHLFLYEVQVGDLAQSPQGQSSVRKKENREGENTAILKSPHWFWILCKGCHEAHCRAVGHSKMGTEDTGLPGQEPSFTWLGNTEVCRCVAPLSLSATGIATLEPNLCMALSFQIASTEVTSKLFSFKRQKCS